MGMDWKKVVTPPSVTAAAMLLAGVLSLQTVKSALGLILHKQPISLRRDLDLMSDHFGGYEMITAESMSKEMENSLGTPYYISWVFRDSRLRPEEPGAAVRMHVAYYTGKADTIPHVPELCFVASGVHGLDSRQIEVDLEAPGLAVGPDGRVTAQSAAGETVHLPSTRVPMDMFTFRPRGSQQEVAVMYFFVANGRYYGSKLGVRAMSAVNVRDRYAYYCKIELMPGFLRPHPETGKLIFAGGVADQAKAIEVLRRFLSLALPEVMTCLPDWEEVRQGRYPPHG